MLATVVPIAIVVGIVITSTAVAARIAGTNGPDLIRGTAKADRLYGRAGDDRIYGMAGKDHIIPGPGKDRVFCGAGIDRVTADLADVVARDCEIVSRPREQVLVLDAFMSAQEGCTDRVAEFASTVTRAYVCVLLERPLVRSHAARIEWVAPSGATFPLAGTLPAGHSALFAWIEFQVNAEIGSWVVRYYFDDVLAGEVPFQRV